MSLATVSSCLGQSGLSQTRIGSTVDIPLPSTVAKGSMTFCFIPAGSFKMGSPADETGHKADEKQVSKTLSKPFWLAKTEVTQAQWEAVMGGNPSIYKGANRPVGNVSWEDAQAFITKLNEKLILPQGWNFALPTETQWEYACRAGEKGPFSGGNVDEVAWFGGNAGSPHEVGEKKANAWGLHDMHENVLEWCADRYAASRQPRNGVVPIDATTTTKRKYVMRGGAVQFDRETCRAAYRWSQDMNNSENNLQNFIGFRPALVPSR